MSDPREMHDKIKGMQEEVLDIVTGALPTARHCLDPTRPERWTASQVALFKSLFGAVMPSLSHVKHERPALSLDDMSDDALLAIVNAERTRAIASAARGKVHHVPTLKQPPAPDSTDGLIGLLTPASTPARATCGRAGADALQDAMVAAHDPAALRDLS